MASEPFSGGPYHMIEAFDGYACMCECPLNEKITTDGVWESICNKLQNIAEVIRSVD